MQKIPENLRRLVLCENRVWNVEEGNEPRFARTWEEVFSCLEIVEKRESAARIYAERAQHSRVYSCGSAVGDDEDEEANDHREKLKE
jgi:hypothetical protein